MLQELSIRNFAIIDDLHIRFCEGLTVLSGETGAGKSILISAVNLLLGSRASATLIRSGCETAELEALFQISAASSVAQTMAAHGYNAEEGIVVRRIVSRIDSNRIYINGRLATRQTLNAITENLASISGQHVHQNLLKEEQHLLILDQFGGLLSLRKSVSEAYLQLLPLIEKLNELETLKRRQAQHVELLQYQKNEITDTNIVPGEDVALEQERTRLKNSEFLFQTVYGGIEELYSRQGSVSERLVEVEKALDKAGQIDRALKSQTESLAQITFELEDLVEALRNYLNTLQMDENRLAEVEERRDILNRLKRKYGGSLQEVLAHLEAITRELSTVENIDNEIAATETKIRELHANLSGLALRLSQQRKTTAEHLAAKIAAELAALKMPQTEFKIMLNRVSAQENTIKHLKVNEHLITEAGVDRAMFLIAPNVGEALKPLAAIASGGELSRVVLAIKAILAETDSVETVIFDEVDAGIGGGVAEVVGQKLADLAHHHQIICITHLPQIAKFANHHFSISKSVSAGRTRTNIHPLDQSGRIEEIARMLGGVEITPTTLAHAREMLES
jgi:DNA repair protein RecN (Recombination protein N)